MVLIIGARGAGKTEYVRSLGYADADVGTSCGDGRPVLTGLEALVRVINHPLLRRLPFILATPNDHDGYAQEIALLRGRFGEDNNGK